MLAHCADDLARVEENTLYDIKIRIDRNFQKLRGTFVSVDPETMMTEFQPIGFRCMTLRLSYGEIWSVEGAEGDNKGD